MNIGRYKCCRSILLPVILSLACGLCFGQEADLQNVLSPSGGSYAGNGLILDFSIGEWTVLNMENSNGQVGNVILNEYYVTVDVEEHTNEDLGINIFPNPVSEWVNLKLDNRTTLKPVAYSLLSTEGKLLQKGLWPDNTSEIKIGLGNLVAQSYILQVLGKNNQILNSYKIIKAK